MSRFAVKTAVIALTTLLLSVLSAAAQSNYQIQPGDQLSVEVLEDPGLNRQLLVLPDGSVSFPFAGTLQAAGQSVSQLESTISSGIASNFATEPNVFVTVSSLNQPSETPVEEVPTIDIYFTGEVGTPGLVQVQPGTTFLQGLSQSGGLTEFAATKRIQLRRTDPRTNRPAVYNIDYRALANGAALSNEIVLQDGDVILVPERGLFE